MIELTWQRVDVSRYIDYKRDGYRQTRSSGHNKKGTIYRYAKRVGCTIYRIREIYGNSNIEPGAKIQWEEKYTTLIIKSAAELRGIRWSVSINGKRDVNHRDDGPAIIRYYDYPVIGETKWYIHVVDITEEVTAWLAEMDLPPFYEWNDGHKALFKLRFGGVGYQP